MRPPAGSRASKLVDLDLPVVVFVPVALPVPLVSSASSSSLLSPVSVAVGCSELRDGCVLVEASEALSESNVYH